MGSLPVWSSRATTRRADDKGLASTGSRHELAAGDDAQPAP